MPKPVFNKVLCFAVTALFICLGISLAAADDVVDDGFGPASSIESRYFTIYYSPQLDPLALAQQLNVSAGERILAGEQKPPAVGNGYSLAEALDTLFLRVCEILDMQLYSYKGNIKICADQAQLAGIYRKIFDKDLGDAKSFYIYSFNTIYLAASSFRQGIAGHEIGHAIINHYFVVQPSIKVQEVLAGYVEYQLRKQTGGELAR